MSAGASPPPNVPEGVERVADAVLYEGYLLYPYRRSSQKNRLRWQFGVVAPKPPREEAGEPWFAQTECLVETPARLDREDAADAAELRVRLRCLVPQPANEEPLGEWLEGVPCAVDLPPWAVLPGASSDVPVGGLPFPVQVRFSAARAGGYTRIRIRLENLVSWDESFGVDRDRMLRHALVSAHLILRLAGGRFVSLLDPPEDAVASAAGCANRHTWPVLVGDPERRDMMLSSPIILYDFPEVPAQSPGPFCDATEIDELLSLRILTLTDEERAIARQSDPRAQAILECAEGLTPAHLSSLHGMRRAPHPDAEAGPEEAAVCIDGVWIRKGSRVRLRPVRRSDAIDRFLDGRHATVAGVNRDFERRTYVAVTPDGDPAASLHTAMGRFLFFDPAEVEPLDDAGNPLASGSDRG